MKLALSRSIILFLFALVSTGFSETFHLKDGRTLEGRLIRESEDSYLVEVQVGRGIWDEVTLSKNDVLKIDQPKQNEKDFDELNKLLPIPDLLGPEEYNARIAQIRQFIARNPDSSLGEKAQEIFDAHIAEQKVIEEGGIKVNGRLINAADRLSDHYEIESRAAEAEIVRLAQSGALLNALRTFSQFEEQFSGSEAWYSLLPLMQQVVAAHQAQAREMLDALDARIARQEVGLSRMAPEERQTTLRAIAERDAALKARHEQERGTRGYWLSINPDYKPALDETIRMADQEIRRLTSAANQTLRQPTPSEVWRNAYAAIQSGDESQVRTAIQTARSARLPESYLKMLQELADDAQRRTEEANRRDEAEKLAAEAENSELPEE